ncbi:MAG: hypothetical protein C0179_00890 [Fervidicoccus sp.]|jgi:hypothetical protein|nr:MAG: hypothetical protein C0179_00890 [Fervidicoccus sp.]
MSINPKTFKKWSRIVQFAIKIFIELVCLFIIFTRFKVSIRLNTLKFRFYLWRKRIPKDLRKVLVEKYSDYMKTNFEITRFFKIPHPFDVKIMKDRQLL